MLFFASSCLWGGFVVSVAGELVACSATKLTAMGMKGIHMPRNNQAANKRTASNSPDPSPGLKAFKRAKYTITAKMNETRG